ncbi:MAG: chitobiase/beta-hexosaminidase C-terminal domain-containing protein [Oscillospiraceae bacterium]
MSATDGAYDAVPLGENTSITIKIEPNQNYQLDTGRGVTLRVNSNEYAATNDDLTALTSDSGFTYDLSTLLGGAPVSESSFELEFGFEEKTTGNDNFRFTCQGDPKGGTVSYKTDSAADYIPLDFGEGNSASITLGDSDTMITIKIEPDTENGFLLDTDRGVILRVDGTEMFTANGGDVSDFTSGYTFDLSSYIGDSIISESTFELEFEIKNQNGGASGFRPYEGNYSGTKVDNVPLTVTGNVDFCINDSELFNITGENTMSLTCDYTYDESGYVDFYVQWRLDNRYTSIVINGTDYYSQLPTPDTPEGRQALLDACKGQFNEFKLKVPYSESYTVSGTVKTLDESDSDYWQIGNFLWFYKETSGADEDDLILNGKMELIGITFNDEPFEQTEYFNWDDDGKNGGSAVLPAGAEITVKIIPEYGYQLTSFGVNGFGFGTGTEQSVFTFVVEQGNFHLGASITKVEDKVESGSDAVTDGNIQLGDGEIDTGSVVLSVDTAGDENRSDFEDELANHNDLNGYTIGSILDINLSQVLYKGNTTDFWETPLNDLSSEAEISLDLTGNFTDVVVLHQNHDGSFEMLPTAFENGKITFTTDSFSEFALAVEEMNTDSGCLCVGFDNRNDENSKVMVDVGDGKPYPADPWKWSEYSDGDSEIKFTVTVPEDRKEHTPIIDVEEDRNPNNHKSIIPTKNDDGSYSFTIIPNDLFDGISEPSIIVFVNWTEFDKIYPDDEHFMIHTNIFCDDSGNENGTILVLGMTADDSASLGSEKKYLFAKPSSTSNLHVIFIPDSGKDLCGFFVGETEYGFENGAPLPEPQSDGSYDFTLSVDGNEPEIIIDAVFGDVTEQVAMPDISPNGGTFTDSQTVTITCTTENATIFYTTDGTAPTTSSTTYTGAFTISETATVKAIAVKDGMNDSAVAAAEFTIEIPPIITDVEVTSSKVIVKYTVSESSEVKTVDYTFDEVTEEIVDYMKSKNIQLVIDFVNNFTAADTDIILTDAQLKAIEYVLEHDLG